MLNKRLQNLNKENNNILDEEDNNNNEITEQNLYINKEYNEYAVNGELNNK